MHTMSDLGFALPRTLTAAPAPAAETTPESAAAWLRAEEAHVAAAVKDSPSNRRSDGRPFRTGFCGPSSGPCRDKGHRCPFIARNGAAAAVKAYVCTCDCHVPAT